MLEAKVTGQLCDLFPGAEMALFGKHGSDMCTAAIRTARLHTRRRTVLYSGYHGWHDLVRAWRHCKPAVEEPLGGARVVPGLTSTTPADSMRLVDQRRGGHTPLV
jgi:glutamate-1-semialdehyde aminotransferase